MVHNIPHRLIAEKAIYVNYVELQDGKGSTSYCYIAVRAKNMNMFKRSLKMPNFDPEDYGVIIESGEGKPSSYIKEQMKLLYDCKEESIAAY